MELTAYDLAHELGHAVDFTHNDSERRGRWLEIRNADPSTPWFGCSGCEDYATGAGDYAEVFAFWQVGEVNFRSRVAPPPSADELEQLIPLFAETEPEDKPQEPDELTPATTPEDGRDQDERRHEEEPRDRGEPGLLEGALPFPSDTQNSGTRRLQQTRSRGGGV